ncbi:nucleotidyltransferase domain-containing protein [Streptomyces ehimensis]|uniref:Nucleotidyltransferase domain-containing protein n=1 Tax=Streptomyces ehimensis TaxID=68195 RepID=A0ABV9BV67_9ACTN
MPTALSPALAELHLAELAEANRPAQQPLLTRIAELLATSPKVTYLLVRGSFALGTADRFSDVDFLVGVHDGDLAAFATALDDLMTVAATVAATEAQAAWAATGEEAASAARVAAARRVEPAAVRRAVEAPVRDRAPSTSTPEVAAAVMSAAREDRAATATTTPSTSPRPR